MRYVIVKNGVVDNVTEWNAETPWSPPQGTVAYAFEGPVSAGWQWNDGSPADPNPPVEVEPPPPLTPEQKLAALGLTIDDLRQLLGL